MKPAIREILEQKSPLSGPFRFYEKTIRFTDSIRKLGIKVRYPRTAYDPDLLDQIFSRFSHLINLPEPSLGPLKQAMELNEIDFTRVPLGEVPAFSLPYPEDDLAMMLYLLSRPWFLALHDECRVDERIWEEGACPLCHGRPVITWIAGDDRRHASCPFCGTTGYVSRTGCAICQSAEAGSQEIFLFEGEKGFAVTTCDRCRSYFKTVHQPVISRLSAEVADLASLPLDVLIQERGFMRRAPNPIGMRKITTRG